VLWPRIVTEGMTVLQSAVSHSVNGDMHCIYKSSGSLHCLYKTSALVLVLEYDIKLYY